MQQGLIKNKALSIIFWILTAICFVVIFYFSSRPADNSSEQSGFLLQWLWSIFGDEFLTEHMIRKIAHLTEYAGTAFMLNWALLFSKGKWAPFVSTICMSLYAISDEVHQLFVEGRSGQVSDWAIDTLGAILGTVIFVCIWALITAMSKKKNNI